MRSFQDAQKQARETCDLL